MPSEELHARAAALKEEMAQYAASDADVSLAVRLGEEIIRMGEERGMKAPELFREWDKNGDGHISKMEALTRDLIGTLPRL